MSIAHIQQLLILTLIALIFCWVGLAQAILSVPLACLGALAIVFGYAFILAAEFVYSPSTALNIRFGERPGFRWSARGGVKFSVRRGSFGGVSLGGSGGGLIGCRPRRHLGVVWSMGSFATAGSGTPGWFACGPPAFRMSPSIWNRCSDRLIRIGPIESAVRRVTSKTGRSPVVIAHSMGGLAVRSWLARQSADARVQRVFTMGSPHRGTWLARFSAMKNGSRCASAAAGWTN